MDRLILGLFKDNSEDLDVIGEIILEWIVRKQGGKLWTGFIWLRIGISCRLLWTW